MKGTYYWIKQSVRNRIAIASKGKCHHCGKMAFRAKVNLRGVLMYYDRASRPYQMDHIKPVSQGGKHTQKNLVLSCSPCNMSKRRKRIVNDPQVQKILTSINRVARRTVIS